MIDALPRLTFLGAGSPTPTAARFGSALLVDVGEERLLFDCGPATTHKLVRAGIDPKTIGTLFFSHHHFDHNADYACFALSRWDQGAGRIPDLVVRGPNATCQVTDRLLGPDGAYAIDWQARVNHPLSQRIYENRGGVLPRRPPAFDTADLVAGDVVEGSGWTVRTALAEHVQPWLDSLAYRLSTPGGDIVYTGDTQPCASVVELATGADTIVCMCWDRDEELLASGEAGGQCGTLGAATMAAQAGVRRLVLTHLAPRIARPEVTEAALADVRSVFDGEVVVAEELATVA